MSVNDPRQAIGEEIYRLVERLYPLCRSITGDGVRETLSILAEYIPLEVHEVETGTPVFDWVIPDEWNIRDAWVKDASGRRVIDFRDSNLHVVSYSVPVRQRMSLAELKAHLHTSEAYPEWIPYRTSYYNRDWGFCLAHRDMLALEEGEYEVCIDATLAPGSLSYGEYFIEGESRDEILLFAHLCHPSLCNDNLSGLAMLTVLARELAKEKSRYSIRFVFAPATIGSITWLSRNRERLSNIRHGLVAAVLGDPGPVHYKPTRDGDAEIDRVVRHVLEQRGEPYELLDFSPWGYDERQFASPGIKLPVGRLTRTPNGCYPEYHTSADNLELVTRGALGDSFAVYREVIEVLNANRRYINLSPCGEPQLGKRGLYRKTGGYKDVEQRQLAMLWILNQSDGEQGLLDIAGKSGIPVRDLACVAEELLACELLKPADTN